MVKLFRKLVAAVLTGVMVLGASADVLASEPGGKVTVTVLQTSDLHGMVNPFDYASNAQTQSSLAHVATIVENERKTDPDLLLIDTGDSLQANYIQEFRNDVPHPMIAALNYLQYDAWVLGNHEFNFEFSSLEKAISEFDGVTLAGNIYKADGSRYQSAYQIFDVKGVKVAIFGIDAPHIPQWEKSDPTHYNNMKFTDPIDETGKILNELEGKADIVIGAIHYGLGVNTAAPAWNRSPLSMLTVWMHSSSGTRMRQWKKRLPGFRCWNPPITASMSVSWYLRWKIKMESGS